MLFATTRSVLIVSLPQEESTGAEQTPPGAFRTFSPS